MCLQLIRMLKYLLAYFAFSFLFCEAFVYRSRTKKPSIIASRLFPFSSTFVFRPIFHLVMFPLFVNTVFLLAFLLIYVFFWFLVFNPHFLDFKIFVYLFLCFGGVKRNSPVLRALVGLSNWPL